MTDDRDEPRPAGAPFQWGLTPGKPVEPEPTPAPAGPLPPEPLPAEPLPPTVAVPPPVSPPAPTPPYVEPDLPPTAAFTMPADLPPTAAFPAATTAFPGQDLEPLPPDPARWMSAPLDSALDGATEVIEAELVGLATPEGEGVEASALDALFGDTQFKEYADELITVPPPRATTGGAAGGAKPPKGPRGSRPAIPRNQKILMGVAGELVAVLALIALFLVGTKLSTVLGPAPAVASPSPTPSPSFIVLPLGPVAPGEYQWDDLLGGECLKPFDSAWQDSYTVVDCAVPHPAQMVHRGTFDDEEIAPYPGVEELQKRINLLCTAPSIIDYSKAGSANDIQVSASFAADADDWNDGNRTYFCFVNRGSGEDFTLSIAMPQVAPSPSATPAP